MSGRQERANRRNANAANDAESTAPNPPAVQEANPAENPDNQDPQEAEAPPQAAQENPEAEEQEPEPAQAAAPPQMDMQGLAQAILQQLLQAVGPNLANIAPAAGQAGVVQFVDPRDSPEPLDRTTRLGSNLYSQSTEPLDIEWDGQAETLASFANALLLRARQARWDKPGPTGITRITRAINQAPGAPAQERIYHLFKDYRSITIEMVTEEYNARAAGRAIQNSQAMYQCLASSLTGQIRTLIFDQPDNMPEVEDGPILFIRAIICSQALGMTSSISALDKLSDLDPAQYKYNITEINTVLFNLMKQSSGLTGNMFPNEAQVTYLLRTYRRIKQPEAWKHWVEARMTDTPPPPAQKLANDAVAYANNLKQENNWTPNKQTITAQIQAMMAQALDKSSKKRKQQDSSDGGKENNGKRRKLDNDKSKPAAKKDPPFLTERKSKDGKDFKVGDTKKWNGKEYHFCDCPNHKRNGAWHSFTAEQCRTRAKWLKSKKESPKEKKDKTTPIEGNVANTNEEDSNNSGSGSAQAQIMSMMGDMFANATSDEARDKIGDIMESLSQL